MTKWSAIIYSPTYEVDFRFLAIPDDFNQKDQDWVKRYIDLTMKDEELDHIRLHPYWSIFTNKNYCVVGVTCMAKDLKFGDELKTFGTDDRGRPTYLFFGYVAKLNGESMLTDLPQYLDKESHQLFQEKLRDIIKRQWNVDNYMNNPEEIPYELDLGTKTKKIAISDIFVDLILKRYKYKYNEIIDLVEGFVLSNRSPSTIWYIICKFLLFSQEKSFLFLCIRGVEKNPILKIQPPDNLLSPKTTNSQDHSEQSSHITKNRQNLSIFFFIEGINIIFFSLIILILKFLDYIQIQDQLIFLLLIPIVIGSVISFLAFKFINAHDDNDRI